MWSLRDGSPMHVIADGRGKLGLIVVNGDERVLALGCTGGCTSHNPCHGCEHSAWSIWSLETGAALQVPREANPRELDDPHEDVLEGLSRFVATLGIGIDVDGERARLGGPAFADGVRVQGRSVQVDGHVWVGDAPVTAAALIDATTFVVGDEAGGVHWVRLRGPAPTGGS